MRKKLTYQNAQKDPGSLPLPPVETIKNLYPRRRYNVHIENPEFTSICPKTGLPDFAVICIDYTPGKKLIELKSLKYYFLAFRSAGLFHEFLVNKVLDDLVRVCHPRKMKVTAVFNPRGGIATTVFASYPP